MCTVIHPLFSKTEIFGLVVMLVDFMTENSNGSGDRHTI
jgi:hypothetical protein